MAGYLMGRDGMPHAVNDEYSAVPPVPYDKTAPNPFDLKLVPIPSSANGEPYVTRDSGQRQDYGSGMRRDITEGKPDFALCLALGVPYEDQLLTRWAALMERGKAKYGERNWELASSDEELARFRASALRHIVQWFTGDSPDEDHAAAVVFNIAAYEATKSKLSDF